MLSSCGDPVQPAAQADQRAGGPVHIPHPIQQPPPAAQRPGVGQMADRLLHQRPQPRLAAVARPLAVGEPLLGPAIPDRRMPVRAAWPAPATPDPAGWRPWRRPAPGPAPPARPAPARGSYPASRHPATTGRRGRSTAPGPGRCGCAVWRRTSTCWLPHCLGRCTRVPSPSGTTAAPASVISARRSPSASRLVTKLPSGWQTPSAASSPSSRSRRSPTAVLQAPHHAAGAPVRQPVQDDRPNRVQAHRQRRWRGATDPGPAG